MKFLFVFAHPDDESFGTGGTIARLVDEGNEVVVLSLTGGGVGVKDDRLKTQVTHDEDLVTKRKIEFANACESLGVKVYRIFDIPDGGITNEMVWGELTNKIANEIDDIKPDFLVTFDHTGWYYHLDHVGTSIATTLARRAATHKVHGMFLSVVRTKILKIRWKYYFPKTDPTTHEVRIKSVVSKKINAILKHESQVPNKVVIQGLRLDPNPTEKFQLVHADKVAEGWLDDNQIFEALST